MPKTTRSNSARQQAMPGSDIGGAEGSGAPSSDATRQQQQQPSTHGESEDAASREARIRGAAYEAYVRRGGAPGDEVQDWLDAEKQVDSQKQ